ncbi:MAG: glycosyltransferase family 39 protein [Anaerolineaceae bacterium]|nr:glycosyltransferase family 39 protein [Anaerolineaceae bacterium]
MRSTLLHQKLVWPVVLLIATNALILAQAPLALRFPAALLLLAFLPGWVWGQSLVDPSLDLIERITLAVGLSLALSIFGSLLTVYLPGPITVSQLLLTLNAITVAGLGVAVRRQQAGGLGLSTRWFIPLSLILLLALAAALRLPRLGYAEFHEDEAEALMLGVRLLQGEDYAIFLHRKGPAQMLLPVAGWLLSDRLTETLARWPFALSSLFSVAAIFILGRRWFNWQIGLIAALLWAINGYAIAFGRMVQYQALIFFMGPLALYCLYLAWQTGRWRWQITGAILLAACLLAHFDALLLLPAAAYLGWIVLTGVSQPGSPDLTSQPHPAGFVSPPFTRRLSLTIVTLALFLGLLAAFYVPYALDPDFGNTTTYLTESRIKPGLLYNNLDLLRRFDRDYSSHFYLPLLGLGLVGLIWQLSSQPIGRQLPGLNQTGRKRGLAAALRPAPRFARGLLVLAAITIWRPEIWQVGSFSLAIVPWLLLLAMGFGLAPTIETQAAWLMFGAPLLGYVFLVDDPRTHLYILYPGAVLLAGAGWGGLVFRSRFRNVFRGLGIALVAGVIPYLALVFLLTESTFTTLRQQWDGSAWEWLYDDLPQPREYFGYPKREGWKAIGALRAQGQFPGDFRSVNEDFIIPIWYNYGQARSCYDTPAHFFVRTTGIEPFGRDTPYHPIAAISRESEPRLQVFSAGDSPAAPPVYRLEDYAAQFDQLASPQRFTQQATPSRPVGTQFGAAITFVGFDLPTSTLAPGDTLYLNLYWQAHQPPGDRYRAFVHLTDGTTLWSQQDDDPACRLPTTIWRAGQHGLGQFRLPIPLDMPPGRYPLIIGLYQVDTLERLTITGGAGQPGDDFLWLGDIEITPRMEN